MNNKTLVAYFTKGGASEKYAQIISDTLTSNGLTVETCNLANNIPDITSYNIIVLGTGVRIFRVYRQWKKILKQKSLRNKNLFMFLLTIKKSPLRMLHIFGEKKQGRP